MTRSSLLAFPLLSLVLALYGCDAPKDDGSSDGEETGSETDTDTDTDATVNDADGDGVTAADGDCDDADATRFPGRLEDCDGLDNNCNDQIDEGMPDTDADGTADCTDVEECDGVDNDGDGTIDEGFADVDGNGVADCVGTEACDGVDNNADGRVDEGFDLDGDGVTQCASDCDDGDASISPSATEVPGDLVDNDCDSLVDEGDWSEGDLALTEFMMNPGRVADPHGEWFEVYNTTDRTLILNGLVFSSSIDGDEHVVDSPDLLLLEPGEFFVFGNNADLRSNGGVEIGYEYSDIVLANESDELVISAEGLVIDALTWDDGTLFPDPDGASIGTDMGIYDAFTNDDPTLWCAATVAWNALSDKGSPGAGNEYCSTYDHDGDGYNGAQGDCDDDDTTTYPDAWEGTDPADNDCDGDAETAPVAVVTATSTGYSCDGINLSSSGSYDIESMPLAYTWELTSAPAESALTSADIETTSSANPTFIPDVAGTYVFTLTVNDGGTDSAPASVSVTVAERPTNSMPFANAGPDQSSSLTSTCTSISYGTAWRCSDCASSTFSLSASATTDPDGDEMTYEWSVLSGETYGSLSASSGESVTLTVSGLDATYGEANTQTVEVEMAATDCMGATNRDRVNVVVTCSGI